MTFPIGNFPDAHFPDAHFPHSVPVATYAKRMIAYGLGFTLGSVKYVPTYGFTPPAAPPPGTGGGLMRPGMRRGPNVGVVAKTRPGQGRGPKTLHV